MTMPFDVPRVPMSTETVNKSTCFQTENINIYGHDKVNIFKRDQQKMRFYNYSEKISKKTNQVEHFTMITYSKLLL